MEVFHQRLEQEHGADVITTAPTVPFHIHFPDKTTLHIQNPYVTLLSLRNPVFQHICRQISAVM